MPHNHKIRHLKMTNTCDFKPDDIFDVQLLIDVGDTCRYFCFIVSAKIDLNIL